VRERLGNDDGAIADYSEAIRAIRRTHGCTLARGAVYARHEAGPRSRCRIATRRCNSIPANPEAYVARGSTYHTAGAAREGHGRPHHRHRPGPGTSALAWTARGNAYFLLGRFDDALGDLKRAVQLDPKNADLQALAAQAQAKVDEIVAKALSNEALPDTISVKLPGTAVTPKPEEKATAAAVTQPVTTPPAKPKPEVKPEVMPAEAAAPPPEPKPVQAPVRPSTAAQAAPAASPAPAAELTAAQHNALGRKALQDEHFAEAIKELSAALKMDPSLSLAYNARGYAYFRQKKYIDALADFDNAIRLNPAYINAYINRSAARRAAGDAAGADVDMAKVRQLVGK
jgi:tetratricopeptide (TPR) repeat protein